MPSEDKPATITIRRGRAEDAAQLALLHRDAD